MVGIYGVDDYRTYSFNPTVAPGTFGVYNDDYDEVEVHKKVISDIESGLLDARIWLDIETPYPLSQINRAFDDLAKRKIVKALIQTSNAES